MRAVSPVNACSTPPVMDEGGLSGQPRRPPSLAGLEDWRQPSPICSVDAGEIQSRRVLFIAAFPEEVTAKGAISAPFQAERVFLRGFCTIGGTTAPNDGLVDRRYGGQEQCR